MTEAEKVWKAIEEELAKGNNATCNAVVYLQLHKTVGEMVKLTDVETVGSIMFAYLLDFYEVVMSERHSKLERPLELIEIEDLQEHALRLCKLALDRQRRARLNDVNNFTLIRKAGIPTNL